MNLVFCSFFNVKVDAKSGQVAWECSHDLSEYIRKELSVPDSFLSQQLSRHSTSLSILELGCGKGIPGCALLSALDEISYPGLVSMCFQDYDEGTLDSITRPAVETHVDSLSDLFKSRLSTSYVASSWESMTIPPGSMNIILSSECIYRSDLFSSHAAIVSQSMCEDGLSLIAGKRYYFGCGGGTIEFSEYLSSSNLRADLAQVFDNGFSNTREILLVSKSSSDSPS